jgi:hypothetical protein
MRHAPNDAGDVEVLPPSQRVTIPSPPPGSVRAPERPGVYCFVQTGDTEAPRRRRPRS